MSGGSGESSTESTSGSSMSSRINRYLLHLRSTVGVEDSWRKSFTVITAGVQMNWRCQLQLAVDRFAPPRSRLVDSMVGASSPDVDGPSGSLGKVTEFFGSSQWFSESVAPGHSSLPPAFPNSQLPSSQAPPPPTPPPLSLVLPFPSVCARICDQVAASSSLPH